MMTDSVLTDYSLNSIVALLPLAALMLIVQVNPYHALVIRGIVGAVAALVYALFGAADVALTEALVGTMLAITLYAVAVRSSLVMRLGVLESGIENGAVQDLLNEEGGSPWLKLKKSLSTVLENYHLRLEPIIYADQPSLHNALLAKDVHAICVPLGRSPLVDSLPSSSSSPSFQLTIRSQRLYDILKGELTSVAIALTDGSGQAGTCPPISHHSSREWSEEQP